MHKLTAASALLLTFCVTSCDDAKSNLAAPTSFAFSGVSLAVTPTTLVAEPSGVGVCPASVPFTIPLRVSVRAGALDVSITDVTTRFVNNAGIPMPQVTLPAPVLTAQFGSMLVAARSALTIPLVIPIGCVTETTGTVVVLVSTRDERGHTGSTEVRAHVR